MSVVFGLSKLLAELTFYDIVHGFGKLLLLFVCGYTIYEATIDAAIQLDFLLLFVAVSFKEHILVLYYAIGTFWICFFDSNAEAIISEMALLENITL